MSDHSELKRLAEACNPSVCADASDEGRRLHDFWDECLPSVVLGLITELENFKSEIPNWTEREILLIAESLALRKDAERYRWLRDSSESIHQFYLSTPIWFTGVKFSKENVDSTIDAAMGKGEQV